MKNSLVATIVSAFLAFAAMMSNPAHATEVFIWEWGGQHRFSNSSFRKVRKVTAYLCPGGEISTRQGGSLRIVEEEVPPPHNATEGHKPMTWPEGWVLNEESKALCGVSHPVPKVGMYYENQVDSYRLGSWDTETYESWEKLPYPWAREALVASFQRMLDAPEWKAPSGKEGTPDCLASYCLGQPVSDDLLYTTNSTDVEVSGVFWELNLETCVGKVVSITLNSREPEFINNKWFFDRHHGTYLETMLEMGWVKGYAPNHPKNTLDRVVHYYPEDALVVLTKEGRMGFREVREKRVSGTPNSIVTLKTTHPDKDAICAPKRQQGL